MGRQSRRKRKGDVRCGGCSAGGGGKKDDKFDTQTHEPVAFSKQEMTGCMAGGL